MNIAKPSKELNLQPLQNRRFPSLNDLLFAILPSTLLGALIGTYLDLYFVGTGLYYFPQRIFPDIFPIHIGFTLFALPLFTAFCLIICYRMTPWQKGCFLFLLSLLMSVMEKQMEAFGFFMHHPAWKHIYTFFGYSLYFIIIYSLFHYLKRQMNSK